MSESHYMTPVEREKQAYERGYRDGENNVIADDHDDNPNSRTSLQLVVLEAQEFIKSQLESAAGIGESYSIGYVKALRNVKQILDKAVIRSPHHGTQ